MDWPTRRRSMPRLRWNRSPPRSCRRALSSRTARPDDGDQPRIERNERRLHPWGVEESRLLKLPATAWRTPAGSAPTCARPPGSMHACRRESNSSPPLIQEDRSPNGDATSSSLCASHPCRHGFSPLYRVRISSGLRSVIQPELPLRRAAGEDHMGGAFDFAPDGLIRGLPTPDVPSVAPPATAIMMLFCAHPLPVKTSRNFWKLTLNWLAP